MSKLKVELANRTGNITVGEMLNYINDTLSMNDRTRKVKFILKMDLDDSPIKPFLYSTRITRSTGERLMKLKD